VSFECFDHFCLGGDLVVEAAETRPDMLVFGNIEQPSARETVGALVVIRAIGFAPG
jgi:hypothetical protein